MKAVEYKDNLHIYTPNDIDTMLEQSVNDKNLKGTNKSIYYYNVPAGFDIETSSFYRDEYGNQVEAPTAGGSDKLEKCSLMYVWQLGINGNIIVGREWGEFKFVIDRIQSTLNLNDKRILIIYVHNLAFEFQYIRTLFEWDNVFNMDIRKPIYARTGGIEFRCSYLLSGYSLDNLAKQLTTHKVRKLVGNLDYKKVRHNETPLTESELAYCVNDIRVLCAYIDERIQADGNITRIPLTKTGYVRKYCRTNCLYKKVNGVRVQNYDYKRLMYELQISGLDEFGALQRAFAGGFTHANAHRVNQVITDVSSYDFTSSYPAVMVAEQYPMSRGVLVHPKSIEQVEYFLNTYCCVFDIEFTNIVQKIPQEASISIHKCVRKSNAVDNNGRLVSADSVTLTITNVDFEVYQQVYQWDSYKVGKMYCYRRGYLPTEFVSSILHLYEKKTTLKGVDGVEKEYLQSKEMLNSTYGMCVTNPLRDLVIYESDTGHWGVEPQSHEELEEKLFKYNNARNRFLFYPWGVFVTSYARKNLFSAIIECGDDYIYSDTDSVKITNADAYLGYFEGYNQDIRDKIRTALEHHKIDFCKAEPTNIKGVKKLLGVWDYEGTYTRFKTLGAKRYMVEEKDALTAGGKTYPVSLTVAGVNKQEAIPYLLETYGQNGIFTAFNDYLCIPRGATGKNILTYIDYEQSGNVTDYEGSTVEFYCNSGVHFAPAEYTLNLTTTYLNYLMNIRLADK